ncbi:disease resistance protein At4g27190-like [Vitis riparia]|uniref:disease resistance protein At4g27190-like n=1 Tax=Vitis riparia TaxID=96939 RepID=UPI00155AEB0D|nr:disease resistance protein At4g27190-like [Vitis riparia]
MEIIATPIAEKVAEKLVARIGRHLGYLFNYRSNILDLTQQIEKLRDGRWLSRAEEIIKETDKFLEDERDANRGCFNLKLRYQQSKKASGQAGDILNKIQETDKFGKVAHEPPLPGIGSSSVSGSEVLESRETTLNQIMEVFRDEDIRMVGVWGMGGVGKTTLVQQVAKQANEEKLFDTVVMALNISQTPNVTKIQGEIASMLGLKLEGGYEAKRAVRLSQSLKKHKKILVILDDIWEPIAFERIGIPYGSDDHKVGYCKVLLTSRDHRVLSKDMGTHRDFHVQHLCKEEAWSLFKQTAVALVTIAKALRDEGVAVWRNALKELKRSAPINIPGVSKNVYSCLELSYNHLESDEVKSLFLLCGLLGDGDISLDDLLKYGMGLDLFDYMDSLEQARDTIVTLVKILKDSSLLLDSLKDVHYRRKPSSLFFVEESNGFIRMHDVVRDVAKAIASKDPHHRFVVNEDVRLQEWEKRDGELRNCAGISLKCTHVHELPEGLVCPKLRFFLLNSNDNSLKIPDTFFKEMKEVRVLSLFRIDLTQLPSSLHFLSNLRTLCLCECGMLKDIAILGGLKKLQILSLVGCEIQELPKEMMQLTDLRMLSLRGSSILVPRNVISSLSRLEHICMMNSNNMWWDAANDRRRNAWLFELKYLSCLRALEVKIPYSYLLPEDVSFENLTRYDIFIGRIVVWDDYDKRALRRLRVEGVKGPHLVKCFSRLLKTVEVLELWGLDDTKHFVYELDNDGFRQLKYLSIFAGFEMQYIMNTIEMEWVDPPHSAFPLLEELQLSYLCNLEAICHGPIPIGCFANLRTLIIEHCGSLKYILWLPTTQGRESVLEFPQLRFLKLKNLRNLIDFYSVGSSRSQEPFIPLFNQKVALPGLELLRLDSMENVITIWDNQHPVGSSSKLKDLYLFGCNNLLTVFPSNFLKGLQSLQILEIEDCCSLKSIFEVGEINREKSDGITIPQLKEMSSFGQNIMSVKKKDPQGYLAFQNLNSLKVGKCASLRYLFPASVVKGLVQLEVLEISDCGVEEIVANENGLEAAPIFLFPRLTSLKLIKLYQLKRFYRGMYTLGCSLLKELVVRNCDEVELLLQEKSLQGEVDKQPLFLVEKVALPGLELLRLDSMENVITIWDNQHPVGSSSKLKDLYLFGCNNLLTVFPSNFLKGLQSLQILEIEDCCSLKSIFEVGEINREISDGITIPQLKEMSSYGQNIMSVKKKDPQGYLAFQNLNSLTVGKCASLRYLFPASVVKGLVQLENTFPNVEALNLVFKGPVEIWCGQFSRESFGKLRVLEIEACHDISLVIPHTIEQLIVRRCDSVEKVIQVEGHAGETLPRLTIMYLEDLPMLRHLSGLGPILQNLQSLQVSRCRNLINLVSPSMAKRLVQLKELTVDYCDEVKEIVENEGGEATDDEILFTKLQKLKLSFLPNLKSFCSARYTFKFPCLIEMQVIKCPKMEFFCKGDSITESLQRVEMGDYGQRWENDLNTTIQKMFMEMNAEPPMEEDSEGRSGSLRPGS